MPLDYSIIMRAIEFSWKREVLPFGLQFNYWEHCANCYLLTELCRMKKVQISRNNLNCNYLVKIIANTIQLSHQKSISVFQDWLTFTQENQWTFFSGYWPLHHIGCHRPYKNCLSPGCCFFWWILYLICVTVHNCWWVHTEGRLKGKCSLALNPKNDLYFPESQGGIRQVCLAHCGWTDLYDRWRFCHQVLGKVDLQMNSSEMYFQGLLPEENYNKESLRLLMG